MVEARSLNALSGTQREILRALKVSHELRTEELARRIFITPGAVRHHLALLHRAGFIVYRQESDGRGRPHFIYSLTPAGDALFPNTYREFALGLIDGLQHHAPELLDRILEDANANRLKLSEIRDDQEAAERAESIRRVLDDEGYMPTLLPRPDGYELTLNHCPVLEIARAEPRVCAAEQRYIADATGAQPARSSWRIDDGGFYCAYHIPPRSLEQGGNAASSES